MLQPVTSRHNASSGKRIDNTTITSLPFAQVLPVGSSQKTTSNNAGNSNASAIRPIAHEEVIQVAPDRYSYFGRSFTFCDGKYFCGLCTKYWFDVIGALDLVTRHMRQVHASKSMLLVFELARKF